MDQNDEIESESNNSQDSQGTKQFKAATVKLKTEALRRLQLGTDDELEVEDRENSENNNLSNVEAVTEKPSSKGRSYNNLENSVSPDNEENISITKILKNNSNNIEEQIDKNSHEYEQSVVTPLEVDSSQFHDANGSSKNKLLDGRDSDAVLSISKETMDDENNELEKQDATESQHNIHSQVDEELSKLEQNGEEQAKPLGQISQQELQDLAHVLEPSSEEMTDGENSQPAHAENLIQGNSKTSVEAHSESDDLEEVHSESEDHVQEDSQGTGKAHRESDHLIRENSRTFEEAYSESDNHEEENLRSTEETHIENDLFKENSKTSEETDKGSEDLLQENAKTNEEASRQIADHILENSKTTEDETHTGSDNHVQEDSETANSRPTEETAHSESFYDPLKENSKTLEDEIHIEDDDRVQEDSQTTEEAYAESPSLLQENSQATVTKDDKPSKNNSVSPENGELIKSNVSEVKEQNVESQSTENNIPTAEIPTAEINNEISEIDMETSEDSKLDATIMHPQVVANTVISSYDNDELVSKPICTGDVPSDFLMLYHSFGYECTKRSNLHLLSAEHVVFSAGNTFQILNLKTRKQINMRSMSGGGIGAIAVHPSRNYFAVSEKGTKPNIIIYEYPSLKMYRILREGTEHAYSNLDFSPSGEKLASVGSSPDFMMTIWDWMKEKIILRSKAFSQDVYKVAFSPESEGHLCSSGTGHIKFWTMANTFTGLKLQGDLGRFGTTELSDISGFVELPDGKVLSGSEWGNMLLWDGGLIKAEITRKKNKTCHQGNIEQFFLDEGELITIGSDGFVKVWDFESIDTADSESERKLFEIEPMSELKVGTDVNLMSMVKSVDEEESSTWYAQDGDGGIWSLDLSFLHTSQSPVKLFTYHAGEISAVSLSPISHVAATTGKDGTIRLFDFFKKSQLCHKKFNTSGCSVLWLPKVVDPNCATILVGFADGVVRHLTVAKNEGRSSKRNTSDISMHLLQVFKPHLKSVTCMAIDVQGKVLATGSEDGTVFFLNINNTFKPIGFVEIGSEVVSLEWSSVSKGNKLLVFGRDGTVIEFKYPQAGKFDTSKSFELPAEELLLTRFKFQSVKDNILRAEEEERKSLEDAEKQEQLEAEKERKKAQGGVSEEDDEDEYQDVHQGDDLKDDENEGLEEDDVVEETIKHEQGNVLRGFYRGTLSDKFFLTMDGWDAGYFYECRFPSKSFEGEEENNRSEDKEEDLVKAIKIPDINDVPITSVSVSKDGDYLALGLQDGSIRVQDIKTSKFEKLEAYWSLNVHDNQKGRVNGICISFDNKFLISVGEDGNIFTFSFMDEERLKTYEETRETFKTQTMESRPVDDIDDPKHYSIELEKQKSEHDNKMRSAEEKKQQVKNNINRLRREFRKLKAKNAELPSYLQLHQQEFIIDPQIKIDTLNETKEKVKLLELEMAWESEKHNIALKKMKQRYKDCVECDRIVLHSFLNDYEVCSFRASVLSKEFHLLVEDNNKKMSGGQNTRKISKARHASISMQGERDHEYSQMPSIKEEAQKLGSKVAHMIEKSEQRRRKRMKRQKEWEEFYRSKPDENYEDPDDVASIALAQMTIGDFKLKSADDYVVPENERINVEKKTSTICDLKEQIHDLKKEFNDRLLKLRDKKINIIEEVGKLLQELEKIQSKLPERLRVTLPKVPEMRPDELPEKRMEYTDEQLIEFRKNVLGLDVTKIEQPQPSTSRTILHNMEPPLTSKTASTRATTDHRHRTTSFVSTFSSIPPSVSSVRGETPDINENPDIIENPHESNDEKNELQLAIDREEEIRLVWKRDQLLKVMEERLVFFDADVRLLRHDKIQLDTTLKNAELRQITLYEELILLKYFEKREKLLAEKLFIKQEELEDMEDKVEECRDVLAMKKEELENLQEREKTLQQTLNNTIGDNNKFEAFLIKVFKKKIKRTKRKDTEEEELFLRGEEEESQSIMSGCGKDGSDESDDDDSDDDYDDSDEEDDTDEEELDDSVCPPGCDKVIFDQIDVLRERRMDLEELLLETKRAVENSKKELDALLKKVKVIDNALKNAGSDLEAFQREKQHKMNELDVVVTLRLNQIQYVENGTLTQDLSKCLVIKRNFLEKLQRRIKELEREKITHKQKYKERKQQHVQMHRDKKAIQTKNKELEERVQQIQMLKFGRLVDLEKLETISVNRVAEELKEKLREQEARDIKEISELDRNIENHRSELTVEVRENTKRLDVYTVLLQENRHLEQHLDSKQKNLGGEFQGTSKGDMEERRRLVQLVQLQGREIEALRDEINILSRKGGNVLPPIKSSISSESSGVTN